MFGVRIIQAAVLATIIPLGIIPGCKGTEDRHNETQVKHVSELFPFKRDKISGKVFVGMKEGNSFSPGVKELKLSSNDLQYLKEWKDLFNVKAVNLEQVEINVNSLPKLPSRGEQSVVFPDNFYSVSIFDRPPECEKEQQTNLVIFPVASFRDERRPVAMTIKDGLEFLPNSLIIKSYLYDSPNNVGAYDLRDEGLSFKVRDESNNGVTNLIVPLQNLPLAIDTGKKMYLIGLDRVKVETGKISRIIVK